MNIPGILGKKLGMTTIFNEDRLSVPITIIKAGPCVILQKKSADKDGYNALQIGLVGKTPRSLRNKAQQGHLKASKNNMIEAIKEVKGDFDKEVGSTLTIENYKEVKSVDVIGISKGKGFQGVVKRHHFRGGRATHGSMFHRAPGSIGSSSDPSRCFKGLRMGGHMGNRRITTANLKVVYISSESHIIMVKGSIPGASNGLVLIRPSLKVQKC